MKTKFRNIFTVSSLVFAGLLNANAAVNFEERNSGLINANESLTVLNEKIASFESELTGTIDYGKEAQMVTQWIADMAEAKATQKVIERGFVAPIESINSFENENTNETANFGREALLITKLIADKEEAKVIQKVMDKGFVAPVETANSFENEIGNENNNEITDFGKEALLITKSIADNEEAKAIQKVMDRGFVAPVETTNSFENEVGNENSNETTNFGKEALLISKLIADKAEADTIQELVAEGKLIANK
jgi:hypothetical protein